MAFFQLGALPAMGVRLRRALPRTFKVLTLMTLTLKSSCTAWRIWVLLARGSATTVYWLSLSDWRVPFSVTRMVLMAVNVFMSFLRQSSRHSFKGAAGEYHLVAAQNLVGVEFLAGRQLDVRHIARGAAQIRVVAVAHDQRGPIHLQGGKHAQKFLGLGRGQLEIVNHHHIPGFEPLGKGLAQGQALDGAVGFLGKITRLGAEDHATPAPERRLEGAGARAPGALLTTPLLASPV